MHPKVNPYAEYWVGSRTDTRQGYSLVSLRARNHKSRPTTLSYRRYVVAMELGRKLEPYERLLRVNGTSDDLNNLIIKKNDFPWQSISVIQLISMHDYLRAAYYPEPSKNVFLVAEDANNTPLDINIAVWTAVSEVLKSVLVVKDQTEIVEAEIVTPQENDQMAETLRQQATCMHEQIDEGEEMIGHHITRTTIVVPEHPMIQLSNLLQRVAPPAEMVNEDLPVIQPQLPVLNNKPTAEHKISLVMKFLGWITQLLWRNPLMKQIHLNKPVHPKGAVFMPGPIPNDPPMLPNTVGVHMPGTTSCIKRIPGTIDYYPTPEVKIVEKTIVITEDRRGNEINREEHTRNIAQLSDGSVSYSLLRFH